MNPSNGKGSAPRPMNNREAYEARFDAIFREQPADNEAEQKEETDVSTANRTPDC